MKTGDGKAASRSAAASPKWPIVFGRKLHQDTQSARRPDPGQLRRLDGQGLDAPAGRSRGEDRARTSRFAKITHQNGLLYWVRLRGLVPFAFRGVVWYQGEDDGRNPNYGEDLKELIESWRKLWNRPDMPFYFAQIAQTGYAGGMLGVWEGQVKVMETVPNTGLAVSNDVYDGTTNGGFKERPDKETGWTLAGGGESASARQGPRRHASGRHRAGEGLRAAGPRALRADVRFARNPAATRCSVKFKYAGSGLATRDGKTPDWFEISDGTQGGQQVEVRQGRGEDRGTGYGRGLRGRGEVAEVRSLRLEHAFAPRK